MFVAHVTVVGGVFEEVLLAVIYWPHWFGGDGKLHKKEFRQNYGSFVDFQKDIIAERTSTGIFGVLFSGMLQLYAVKKFIISYMESCNFPQRT